MPDNDDYREFLEWQREQHEAAEASLFEIVRAAVARMIAAALDLIRGGELDPDTITQAAHTAWRAELVEVIGEIERIYTATATATAERATSVWPPADGIDPAPEVPPVHETAQEYVRAAENRLADVPDEVWQRVSDALAEGYDTGDSPAELAERVAEHLDNDGDVVQQRAERIARTETTSVFNTAAVDGLHAAETVIGPMRKTWVATYDGRTRASHVAANRQTVPLDEPFRVGGARLMFPGDPTGPPGEVVNCRCVVSPVPADVVPELTDEVLERERQRMEREARTAAADVVTDAGEPDPDELEPVDIDAAIEARSRMPRQLRTYWKRRIQFGTPGSFRRCVAELTEHIGPRDARGACANLYHEATGRWPGRRSRRGDTTSIESEDIMSDTATLAANECGCPDTDDAAPRVGVAAARLDSPDIVAEAVANAPDVPPAAWFEPPGLETLTPVTVTADGGVYGHMAPWDVPHRGIRDEDVTAPVSRIDYDLFHNRDVTTADGTTIRAGVLLVGCDHAPNDMDVADARDYHDQVCTPAAVVRAYEDDHGIAFAGALLPGLTVEQVNQLTHLSGEWRSIQLELMAAVGVDEPGFPVADLDATTVAVTASVDTPTARRARSMVAHIPRTTAPAQRGAYDVRTLAAALRAEMAMLDAHDAAVARVDQTLHRYAVHTIDRLDMGSD